jgi:Sec-independent protein translocase protein TatA
MRRAGYPKSTHIAAGALCAACKAFKPSGSDAMSESTESTKQSDTDVKHPHTPAHSDNEKSKMPERQDEGRKQSPADKPGKKPGEGETPVG